jgi:hypothetical protein
MGNNKKAKGVAGSTKMKPLGEKEYEKRCATPR